MSIAQILFIGGLVSGLIFVGLLTRMIVYTYEAVKRIEDKL